MKSLYIRKSSQLVMVLCATLFISTTAMASMVENLSSLSTDFTRMFARTGASDSVDAAVYNPAGSAWLPEGVHMGLDLKFCIRDWSHSRGGTTYDSTNPLFSPPINLIYRKDKLGVYAALGVFSGSGTGEYDKGFTLGKLGPYDLTFPQKSEFTYLVPGLSTGVSWQVTDSLAISGGVRFLYGKTAVDVDEGKLIDASADASGMAPIFGISYKATNRLDLSVRHEMRTKMEYETDSVEGIHPLLPFIKKMLNQRQDIPAQTALGVLYRVTPQTRIGWDGVIAWQKDANRGGTEKNMGNGYYVALALEHDLTKQWTLSTGVIYCDPKDDRDRVPYLTVNPKLEYNGIAAGFKYHPTEALSFNAGISFYEFESYTTPLGIEMNKSHYDASVGAEYSF